MIASANKAAAVDVMLAVEAQELVTMALGDKGR
jgi:hypothetical protein